MDRLAALIEQLPVPEVARVLSRAALGSFVVGVIALGLGLTLSHLLAGLGICVGLGLGLVNVRLLVRSVMKVTELAPEHPKRILATRAMYRLSLTTIVIIGLTVASFQLGVATAGGAAIFYILLIISFGRSLLIHSSDPRSKDPLPEVAT